MNTENNLSFIQDRISEIRSAILYSMSNELIKVPTSIITILKTDEDGYLWFFVNRPAQLMGDEEKSFPARLQFYKKGKPFFIHVSGHAAITEDKETICGFIGDMNHESDVAMQNLMLVKLKMTRAEYQEQKTPTPKKVSLQTVLQNLYSALFKPSYNYRLLQLNAEIA